MQNHHACTTFLQARLDDTPFLMLWKGFPGAKCEEHQFEKLAFHARRSRSWVPDWERGAATQTGELLRKSREPFIEPRFVGAQFSGRYNLGRRRTTSAGILWLGRTSLVGSIGRLSKGQLGISERLVNK
jgi:hypothetical protein